MSWNIQKPGDYINGPLTVAGSATITGAATVGTTLGVTGQLSTANVLKTTGNPSLNAAVATEAFVAHNTGYGAVLYGKGTTFDVALLDQNTVPKLSVTTSGVQVSGDLSVTSGNVVMAASGKGIDFSAKTPDGSGTVGSEVLNDYEEGTWVPTVGGTSTYTANQKASYIKVGRLVTVSFDMEILLIGTGSTTSISGLPFVVGSATSPKFEQCNGSVGYVQSLAVNVYSLSFNAAANGSAINSTSMNTLGGTANVNPAIYGNGTRVQGTVTYMATA